MSKRTRTCGASCYTATEPVCDCICGGVFHGAAGADNRKAILAAVGALPRNEGEMLVLRAAAKRLRAPQTVRLLNG